MSSADTRMAIFQTVVVLGLVGWLGSVWYHSSENYDKKEGITRAFHEQMTTIATEYELPSYSFQLRCIQKKSTISMNVKLISAKNMFIPVAIPLEDSCTTAEVNGLLFNVAYKGSGLPTVTPGAAMDPNMQTKHLLNKDKFVATFQQGFQRSLRKAQDRYEGKMRSKAIVPTKTSIKVPVAPAASKTQVGTYPTTVQQNISGN